MRKVWFSIFLAIIFVVSGLISYSILKLTANKSNESVINKVETKPSVSFENVDEDKRINFLLLGFGGVGHDGGFLSDVIMLVNVDSLNKQVTLVSIPRDLWVGVPIRSDKSQNFKINAAYAIGQDDRGYPLKEPQYKGQFGGGKLAMKVVGDMLDVKISNFVAVDFSSFENIVDLLGGIDVMVPKTFDDHFYPVKGLENETCGFTAEYIAEIHQKFSGFDLEKQFTCRYERLHFDKGSAHMEGKTSLKFVRSRHSNEYGGDFARGERQNAVLFALKDKLVSIYAYKNADAIYKQFQNLVKTDANAQTFKSLAEMFGETKEYTVKHVGLSTDNVLVNGRSSDGQFILSPKLGENKWDGVRKYVLDQISSN